MNKEEEFIAFHGDIDRSKSTGTNNLIKKGAKLVTSPEDIAKEFVFLHKKEIKKKVLQYENVEVKEEYKNIYKAIGEEPIDVNEIIKLSGENLRDAMAKLTMLELEGRIKSVSGNRYIRNAKE